MISAWGYINLPPMQRLRDADDLENSGLRDPERTYKHEEADDTFHLEED